MQYLANEIEKRDKLIFHQLSETKEGSIDDNILCSKSRIYNIYFNSID